MPSRSSAGGPALCTSCATLTFLSCSGTSTGNAQCWCLEDSVAPCMFVNIPSYQVYRHGVTAGGKREWRGVESRSGNCGDGGTVGPSIWIA